MESMFLPMINSVHILLIVTKNKWGKIIFLDKIWVSKVFADPGIASISIEVGERVGACWHVYANGHWSLHCCIYAKRKSNGSNFFYALTATAANWFEQTRKHHTIPFQRKTTTFTVDFLMGNVVDSKSLPLVFLREPSGRASERASKKKWMEISTVASKVLYGCRKRTHK